MLPSISVVIGTFGDEAVWGPLAERALTSVEAQTWRPADTTWVHAASLREARNRGAAQASGSHLVFLDADDELDGRFIEEMCKAVELAESDGHPYLVRPATLGVRPDGVEDESPVVIPQRDLMTGNFMVISTAVSHELFHRVGGFDEWPIYEDWDLWIRCSLAGARFAAAPEAIYRIHVRESSRNQQDRHLQVRVFNEIRRRHRVGGSRGRRR